MTEPFSACIIMSAPLSAPFWNARKIWPSSDRKTPLYAMKSLKLVTPSFTSSSIATSDSGWMSERIWWNP